jgi:hypothetical protein
MNKNYYQIYDVLFDEYRYDYLDSKLRGGYQRFLRRRFIEYERFLYDQVDILDYISSIIQRLEYSDGMRLRPDAKYFLLVNFHHMIVEPILMSNLEGENKLSFDEIGPAIAEDLHRIIELAFKSLGNEKELSGHQIMKVIDKNWAEFKTTRFQVWG